MKPIDLYKSPHIKESKDIYHITEFLGIGDDNYTTIYEEKNEKIVSKYYIDINIDGERYIEMYSVWYDGKPFMICQVAGRGGRDHRENFITDSEVCIAAVKYIKTHLMDAAEEDSIPLFNPDEDCEQLDAFYSIRVSDVYDPNFIPKYKVGDTVIAKVIKDHLRMRYAFDRAEYVETRCKILSVDRYNPNTTYHMKQLDRRWENEQEKKARGCKDLIGEMIFDRDKGEVGASGNDETILRLATNED